METSHEVRIGDRRVWIGWDPAEMVSGVVAERSLALHAQTRVDVRRLALAELRAKGLYVRPTERRKGAVGHQLWDMISEAPMSTEHAISRFYVPYLCRYSGWALFTDGDVLFRSDVGELFALADPHYAVQVVKHPPLLAEGTKKDGVPQQAYPCKNWSSVMLFNCAHPANQALTLDVLDTWPGRDLHAFRWLSDDLIGALPSAFNYLVNVTAQPDPVRIAHYTLGVPCLPGHENDPFADEWFAVAKMAGYRLKLKATG